MQKQQDNYHEGNPVSSPSRGTRVSNSKSDDSVDNPNFPWTPTIKLEPSGVKLENFADVEDEAAILPQDDEIGSHARNQQLQVLPYYAQLEQHPPQELGSALGREAHPHYVPNQQQDHYRGMGYGAGTSDQNHDNQEAGSAPPLQSSSQSQSQHQGTIQNRESTQIRPTSNNFALVAAWRTRTHKHHGQIRLEKKYYPEENLRLNFINDRRRVEIVVRKEGRCDSVVETVFQRGASYIHELSDSPWINIHVSNVLINYDMYSLIYVNAADQREASALFLNYQGSP